VLVSPADKEEEEGIRRIGSVQLIETKNFTGQYDTPRSDIGFISLRLPSLSQLSLSFFFLFVNKKIFEKLMQGNPQQDRGHESG
jgi:hypothetical protein